MKPLRILKPSNKAQCLKWGEHLELLKLLPQHGHLLKRLMSLE